MELTVKRLDSKGVEVTSNDELGLLVICQQTTKTEHEDIKSKLENALDLISSVDVFYAWSNASIFIFDTDKFDDIGRKIISDTLPKTKHAVVFNGQQVKGNGINDMYITHDKNGVTVGKKFYKLLVFKKGNK